MVGTTHANDTTSAPGDMGMVGTIDVAGLKREIINRFRSRDFEIPLLPQIATKVMRLSSDPNSSLQDFTDLIKQDQYISGQIIRIANSPVYGGLCEVTNLTRALVQIGIRTVKDLIMGISMGTTIFRNRYFQEEMDRLWKHSMATAYISQEIGIAKRIDSEHAFLCGLVHDIGMPFLVNIIANMTKRSPQKLVVQKEDLFLVLHQLHQAVGGILARSWKFSGSVMQVVAHHHDYNTLEGEARLLGNIVYVADRIAMQLDFGLAEGEESIDLDDAYNELDLGPGRADGFLETLPGKVESYIATVVFG